MKLNPISMDYVKSFCFQFHPLEASQKDKVEWRKCAIAVDESNRRLYNKPKKQCNNDLDSDTPKSTSTQPQSLE